MGWYDDFLKKARARQTAPGVSLGTSQSRQYGMDNANNQAMLDTNLFRSPTGIFGDPNKDLSNPTAYLAAIGRDNPAQATESAQANGSNGGGLRNFFEGIQGNIKNLLANAPQQQAQNDLGVEEKAPVYGKTLADFLGQAQSMTGSGIANQLAALAAQEGRLKDQAASGDAKLASMYGALRRQADKDAASNQQLISRGRNDSKRMTQNQQKALLNANNKVRNSQNQTLKNLGISGANNRGKGKKGAAATQAEAAAVQNSGVQSIGNAAGQELISKGISQGAHDKGMALAGDFAGAGRRAGLQDALLNALAEISGQTAQLKDSAAAQTQSLAAQLYNSDYAQWAAQRDWETNRDDEAWNRQMQMQQMGLDQDAANAQAQADSLKNMDPYNAAAYQMVQNSGGRVNDQRAAALLSIINAGASGATEQSGMSPFQGGYKALQEAVANGEISGEELSVAMAALFGLTGGYS